MIRTKKDTMTWAEAVAFMRSGGKVTRKSWMEYDFLYMVNEVLYCDGGFPFLPLLGNTAGKWLKFQD
jgi:hypothetical protein